MQSKPSASPLVSLCWLFKLSAPTPSLSLSLIFSVSFFLFLTMKKKQTSICLLSLCYPCIVWGVDRDTFVWFIVRDNSPKWVCLRYSLPHFYSNILYWCNGRENLETRSFTFFLRCGRDRSICISFREPISRFLQCREFVFYFFLSLSLPLPPSLSPFGPF